MYTKQDSIFWWDLDEYLGRNTHYHALPANKKSSIEDGFRLTYYGLMQYQLYKGRQLASIELASIEQISEYISENFDYLVNTFLKKKVKKYSAKEKEDYMHLIEDVVIPYINDFSFEKVSEFRITRENILTFIMQLAIKNQFDINILDDKNQRPTKPFYSQIYPFMVTLLIIDPTNPQKIFENVHNFFVPAMIEERYQNGRSLSNEEISSLTAQIDILENSEDFNYFLHNFSFESWSKSDLVARFKLVFQLSQWTAILLKENIASLTYFDDNNDLYDLIEYYLPLILQSEEELLAFNTSDDDLYAEQKINKHSQFLMPWSVKDFDPRAIEKFYTKMHLQTNFSLDKLYKMMDLSLYTSSYLRLLNLLKDDSKLLETLFIEQKRKALVNTLKLFSVDQEQFVQRAPVGFHLNDIFMDAHNLLKIELFKINLFTKKNDLIPRLDAILKLFSYILALEPTRIKEFDYSLEDLVKYYLILFGPYKQTKPAYRDRDFQLLTNKLLDNIDYFQKKNQRYQNNEKMLVKLGYYTHIYLIEKLLEFSKNKN